YLAGVVDRDGGTVDEERACSGGGQDLGITALDHVAVGQHGDHRVCAGHGGGGAVEDRGATLGSGGGSGGHRVEPAHGVAGGNQVGRHRPTHVAEPQEGDREMLRHGSLSSGWLR